MTWLAGKGKSLWKLLIKQLEKDYEAEAIGNLFPAIGKHEHETAQQDHDKQWLRTPDSKKELNAIRRSHASTSGGIVYINTSTGKMGAITILDIIIAEYDGTEYIVGNHSENLTKIEPCCFEAEFLVKDISIYFPSDAFEPGNDKRSWFVGRRSEVCGTASPPEDWDGTPTYVPLFFPVHSFDELPVGLAGEELQDALADLGEEFQIMQWWALAMEECRSERNGKALAGGIVSNKPWHCTPSMFVPIKMIPAHDPNHKMVTNAVWKEHKLAASQYLAKYLKTDIEKLSWLNRLLDFKVRNCKDFVDDDGPASKKQKKDESG